jgi:hypothetical protein
MDAAEGGFSMVGRLAAPIESRDYHQANGQRQQAADARRFGWGNRRSRVD